MLEHHLRTYYRFLGHSGYWSRVGSLDYITGQYSQAFVFGEDAVIEYAKRYDTKRNVFISRAARDKEGKPVECHTISFDIDPIRPKGEAATHEQHLNAVRAGRKILSVFPNGYLASSGNGCLLLYHTDHSVLSIPDYYKREGVLIKDLQKLVDGLGVKIDETNYVEAITKSLGTMSTKGEISLRRLSRWIDHPVQPYKRCEKLLERLKTITPEQPTNASVDLSKLETAFNGDRSTADFHLVAYLKKSGVSAASALQALRSNPIGRQTDEKDQARLISKIYGEAAVASVGQGSGQGYFDELARASDEEGTDRIITGLRNLDSAIKQLPRGEISTVGARSGFGKSSFACTVAEYHRKLGGRVLYFSTEMQSFYIMHKIVSVACNIPIQKLLDKSFTATEADRIKAYRKEFETSPIVICDEFQPTLQLVQNKVLEAKPDLIIFDHISQVATYWEHVAEFTRGLKDIASKEHLPVLMLAELNEPPRAKDGSVAQNNRGDIRGSQEILFLSALFMFVSNPYEMKGDSQHTEMHIAKNRYGISGLVVPLAVDKSTGKFLDREASDATNLQEL